MMQNSSLITELITALRALPGIGPKSAQRIAFYLLQRDREAGLQLAESLAHAMTEIGQCQKCRTFTEQPICNICANPRRHQIPQLCIVETPADIYAIEQTGQYSGQYFVLMGHLSPLDGLGPKEIGLEQLAQRLQSERFTEVILATTPTVEGEATANYIAQLCQQQQISVTRIAQGIPLGGELDSVDGMTLSHSFVGRQKIQF